MLVSICKSNFESPKEKLSFREEIDKFSLSQITNSIESLFGVKSPLHVTCKKFTIMCFEFEIFINEFHLGVCNSPIDRNNLNLTQIIILIQFFKIELLQRNSITKFVRVLGPISLRIITCK